jgi:hypothetical protein
LNRLLTPALLAIATVGLAACGAAASAGSASATPKPAASPGFLGRNGASGELVNINGMTLVVNAASGDTTVLYTATTTFQRTSTGSFGDIVAGKCIVATGQKDAAGKVTATAIRLSDPVNSACATGVPAGGAGPGGGTRPTPRPRPTPSGAAANFTFVSGQVTTVSGTSVTIQPATGASQAVTVPTSVTVNKSAAAAATDLKVHQCVSANGPKASSGTVTARSITIVPSGPTGCATGGGRGGFGGGGGGGGFGGGGGAPGPPGGSD